MSNKKVLEQLVKDGWEDRDVSLGPGSSIWAKGELRLFYDKVSDRVTYMYDLSQKGFKYKGQIPENYK